MATRLLPLRASANDRAVVFIHGIAGLPESWDGFSKILQDDERLAQWDILTFDYSEHSSLGFRKSRTTLRVIAEMLAKELASVPQYRQLAVVAHNAGGLIAQLAVLKHDELVERLAHLFVLGPANGGVRIHLPAYVRPFADKIMPLARALMPIYDQVEDLRPDSPLLTEINADWRHRFGEAAPFSQGWIAGRHDRFALYEGLTYVDSAGRFIVDAPSHDSLIKPQDAQAETVRIVVQGLLDLSPPAAPREAAQGVASLERKVVEERFDVFLHCDSADREEVRELAAQLSQDGIRVWLEEDRGAGRRFRQVHAHDLERIGALGICIGKTGAARPLRQERELIDEYERRKRPVIPIFLRTAPLPGDILRQPLDDFTPVDFRSGDDLPLLEAGIRGKHPPRRQTSVPRPPTARGRGRNRLKNALIAGSAAVAVVAIGVPLYEWYVASTSAPGSQPTPRNRSHYVRRANAERVLVFVHGVIGNAGDTWTNDNGAYWPELIADDRDFDGTDVYVDQYDSGVGNRLRIDELANGMAERLQANGVLDHRQIIFVTHSMGGLVTQRFLTLNRAVGRKVPALFLYGTPQSGAQIATFLSTFSLDPVLGEMGDPDAYLKTVLTDWRSARQDWESQGVSVRRYCAYEKLPVNGVVIVGETSGTTLCDDQPLAINANHIGIVKPAGRDDASYTFLKNRWPRIPGPGAASESERQPTSASRATPPDLEAPSPAAFGTVPPAVDCQPYTPERPSNVTLQPGDLVVAGGGGVYRLDRDMKETKITAGKHVIDARGVAVAPSGQIYLSSTACRKGAIVQVDPKSGTQTPLFFGFGTPMGIYTNGETILVGDENPRQSGQWGELWQISLKERTRKSIHAFTQDAVATSIARDPQTGDLFFAVRRTLYWREVKKEGPLRPLDFEGLVNIHALAITPNGEMYIGEYDNGGIMLIQRGAPTALKKFPGFPILWNLGAAADGKSLFAATGSGTNAKVYRIPLTGNERSTQVWSASSDGFAVFLAVVGQLNASSEQ